MKRLLTLTIIGAFSLAMPASAQVRVRQVADYAPVRAETTHLVDPSGQAVHGPWQRWINEAKVPTYAGTQILDVSTYDAFIVCGGGICTAPPGPCDWSTCGTGHPETWLPSDSTRDNLYYEHGHIIDFMVATNGDRAAFMRIWRLPGTVADWWKNEDQFLLGKVYPPGELWSSAYELCADGAGDLDSIRAAQGRLSLGRWAVAAQQRSCALFRRLDPH